MKIAQGRRIKVFILQALLFFGVAVFTLPSFAEESDEKGSTIQNRFARKDGTFYVHLTGAMHVRNDFYSVLGLGLDVGYYLAEPFAVEIRGMLLQSSLSEPAIDLKNRTGLTPDTYPQNGLITAGARYSLGYGKVLLFDAYVMHFDPQIFISGGVAFAERRIIPTLLYGVSFYNHFKWGLQFKIDLAGSVQFENRSERGNVTSFAFMPIFGIGWSTVKSNRPKIKKEEVDEERKNE